MKSSLALTLAFCAVLPGHLAAQETLPDAGAIALPDMTFGDDPQVAKQGFKFFFHHNPDIEFADAYRDFAECHSMIEKHTALMLPGFVPWQEENRPKDYVQQPMYGLVGATLSAIIGPKMERGQRNSMMRLCLERRGYVRYAVDQDAYDSLWEGSPQDVVAKLARVATMPAPQVAPLGDAE